MCPAGTQTVAFALDSSQVASSSCVANGAFATAAPTVIQLENTKLTIKPIGQLAMKCGAFTIPPAHVHSY